MKLQVPPFSASETSKSIDAAISNPKELDKGLMGGFDPKAVAFFTQEVKRLGALDKLTFEKSDVVHGVTRTLGLTVSAPNGDTITIGNFLNGQDAGNTSVARRNATGQLVRDSKMPSAVSFRDGQIATLNFGAPPSVPTIGDTRADIPTAAKFTDGKVSSLVFGEYAPYAPMRVVLYNKDGRPTCVMNDSGDGSGKTTPIENGVPLSDVQMGNNAPSVRAETYLQNLSNKLKGSGLDEALPVFSRPEPESTMLQGPTSIARPMSRESRGMNI